MQTADQRQGPARRARPRSSSARSVDGRVHFVAARDARARGARREGRPGRQGRGAGRGRGRRRQGHDGPGRRQGPDKLPAALDAARAAIAAALGVSAAAGRATASGAVTRGLPGCSVNRFPDPRGRPASQSLDAGLKQMGQGRASRADRRACAAETRVVLGNAHADHRGRRAGDRRSGPVSRRRAARTSRATAVRTTSTTRSCRVFARPLTPRMMALWDDGPLEVAEHARRGRRATWSATSSGRAPPGPRRRAASASRRERDRFASVTQRLSSRYFDPALPRRGAPNGFRIPHSTGRPSAAIESIAKLAELEPATSLAGGSHFGPLVGDVAAQLQRDRRLVDPLRLSPPSGAAASLAAQMRVLALDYGSARCGCALSDATGTLATPIAPVLRPATKAGMRTLRELVAEREVERVVVGLPLSLSGGDSDQTREARAFADRLRSALDGTRPRRPLRRALHDGDRRARGASAPRRRARTRAPRRCCSTTGSRATRTSTAEPAHEPLDGRARGRAPRARARARDAQRGGAARSAGARAAGRGAGAGRQRRPAAAAGAAARGRPGVGLGPAAEPEPDAAPPAPPPMRSFPSARPLDWHPDDDPIGTVAAPQPGAPGMSPHRPVTVPRRRRRPGRWLLIAVPIALLAIFVGWFAWSRLHAAKGDGNGEVTVVIPPGASTREIGDLLADKGVVGSGFFFSLRAASAATTCAPGASCCAATWATPRRSRR